MKKLFAILISAFFILSVLPLAACTTSPKPQPSNQREEQTEVPAVKITEAPEITEAPTEVITEEPTEAPTETPEPTPARTEHASEETLELAQRVLDMLLENEYRFWAGIERYFVEYEIRKNKMPELTELEEKEDGTLALVEIYEGYIDYYLTSDLTGYYTELKNKMENPYYEYSDEYTTYWEMEMNRSDVEILLSMDAHFNRLTNEQRERFYYALYRIYDSFSGNLIEVFGKGNISTRSEFDISKREQDIDWEPVYIYDE